MAQANFASALRTLFLSNVGTTGPWNTSMRTSQEGCRLSLVPFLREDLQ